MKDRHFKELFRKAVASGGNGDYKKAIKLFSSIVSQTDMYPQALLYLGRSYHALGEYERAVTILKHFINRRPGSSAGYFFLGRSYCALEQYDRAVYCLKKARLRDGNNPHIESFLGLSYLKMRNPEKALVFLEQAVHLDPDNTSIYTGYLNALAVQGVRLFHLGDMEMAGQIFHFLEKADKVSLLNHIYLGIIERELGNIDEAIKHTDRAIALSDDPLLKLRKSSLLYQSGKRKEAADSLETLKHHYPEFQNILPKQEELNKFLAVSLFQENKYVKAIFHARNALKQNTNDIEMHLLIGEAYRNLGEFEKAKNHFHQASRKKPDSLESHLGAAMVFWQMELYQEVLRELKLIESIDGDNDIVEYYRVLCMSRLEYPIEESLAAVQSALKRYGPDLFLLNTLGNEYVRSGFTDLAEKWFRKAIQLAGNNRDSQFGLIRVYRESGKAKQEIQSYKDYLKEEPDDTAIRKQLIHLLVSAKRYKETVKEILKHDAYGRKEKSFQGLPALCYMKTDRFIDAAVIYRQLLRKNPENTEFLRGLIYCYDRSGNTKNAVFFLEKALNNIKPTLFLSLILGVLKYKDGDTDGALEWFRKALSTSRKDWRAYQNIGIIYKRKGIAEFSEMFLSRAKELKAKDTA